MGRRYLGLLLAVSLFALASCSSGNSKKSCGGDTCKIGKRVSVDRQNIQEYK